MRSGLLTSLAVGNGVGVDVGWLGGGGAVGVEDDARACVARMRGAMVEVGATVGVGDGMVVASGVGATF